MRNLAARVLGGVRLSTTEVVGASACAVTFLLWNLCAQGTFIPAALVFFPLLCLACTLAGRPVARLVALDAEHDFATVFLCGFLLLNSALYLLAWISPFSIVVNGLALLAAAVAWSALRPAPDRSEAPDLAYGGAGLLALGVSLAAATLWSQDSLSPIIFSPRAVLLRPFFDSYYHACEIRLFRDAQGASTLHDLRMAGQPVWIYHHASYLVPALVSAATGTDVYLTLGSFMIPAGELLAGLAAYALVRSLWGGGAGVAAMAALMLLPDGSYHGLGNHWISYHWSQQVGPGASYAIAVLGAAWMLVFAGCRAGRVGPVAAGMVTAGLTVHYRAHLFVAAAPLIWVFPGVAFRGASWRWKGAWLVFAVASLVSAGQLSQRIEAVPLLRLDGSSMKHFLGYIVLWTDRSPVRKFYASKFTPDSSMLSDVAWGSFMLGYGVLGYFAVAVAVLALVALGRRALRWPRLVDPEHLAFPFLITLIWLVMSMGLAMNTERAPEHGDELLHRPFVWAYFVVVVWAGGLAYRLFLDRFARRTPPLRAELAVALIPLLVIPAVLGRNVQVGAEWWGRTYSFLSYPRGIYECGRYIRMLADRDDVAQDSENDPRLLFSALCERLPYAAAYFEGKVVPVLSARIEELKTFRSLTDAEAIRRFARERRMRWYLLEPQTRVSWPPALLASPAFSWDGFRVFDFGPLPRMRTARSRAGPARGETVAHNGPRGPS